MENDLQFDRADFTTPAAAACSGCRQPLHGEYFSAQGQVLCARCAENLRARLGDAGSGTGRLVRAILLGLGAAVIGGAIYGGIMAYSGWQVGLISIGVGIIVGKAVRRGSENLGGPRYQILAAALTYAAIAGAYAFDEFHRLAAPDAANITSLVFSAYRLPFAQGAENILGIVIIGFGVWQAWQLNRGVAVEITGPHSLAPGAAATPPALG